MYCSILEEEECDSAGVVPIFAHRAIRFMNHNVQLSSSGITSGKQRLGFLSQTFWKS